MYRAFEYGRKNGGRDTHKTFCTSATEPPEPREPIDKPCPPSQYEFLQASMKPREKRGEKRDRPPGNIMCAVSDGEAVIAIDNMVVLEKQVGAPRGKACLE
jgi:hypothetical protein